MIVLPSVSTHRSAARFAGTVALTLGLGLALALLPAPADAQAVLGRAAAGSTDAPLAGVFVTLNDESGRRAAGFLSRADGGFLIRAPAPGRYVLRAELIGYGSVERAVDLGPNETVRETLRLPLEAVKLEGIIARGTRQRECALRADEGTTLTRLWTEAQKGLRIADWADETGWLRANGYTYQRVLELAELEVLAESVQRAQSLERSAFVAADPETVRAEGFVLASRDEGVLYRGADAALLLSDAFLETHCFGLRERSADGLVGLAFEPGPGRDLPDITGVLWLDAETGRLRTLEYEYTSYPVPFPLPRSRFGGRTEFRHLPGGGVAVERWWIRMPSSLGHSVDGAALRSVRRCGIMAACDDRETLRKLSRAGLAIEEEGGEVLSFRLADGTVLPVADRAAMIGMVVDSTVDGVPAPLEGAEVTIEGTEHRTVTDAHGRFRLDHLPEGTYRLRFHHPRLAELGVERPESVVAEATRGDVAVTTLATPSWSTLARARCDVAADGKPALSGAIVFGAVRDAGTGATIGGARVRLRATAGEAAVAGAGGAPDLEAVTDPAGRFLFCEAPPGPVRLAADYLGRGLREVRLTPAPGSPARADLELVLSTSARVLGRVVRADDRAAVAGVVVRLRETGQRAVTDASGHFAFDSVAPGALSLETEHIAYRPSEGVVAVTGGEQVRVELRVADEVFELDPLIVTTRSRPLLMDQRMGGFYIRQARGLGQFIGRDLLDTRPAAKVTDLLREVSAIAVTRTTNGRILQSRRNSPGASGNNPFCSPMVYLDGVKITHRLGIITPVEPEPDPSPLEEMVRVIDGIPTSEIAGIEIYAGAASVPGEFAGLETQCGVIAIWTRVRDHSPESW